MTAEILPKRVFTTLLRVKPVGKSRPRMTRTGRTYTPQATVNAEAEIRWLLQKESPPLFEGPVYLVATFFIRRPKSAPKSRVFPTTKPDADNLAKLVCDALNGILFVDDCQIIEATIRKVYSDSEGIAIEVGEL